MPNNFGNILAEPYQWLHEEIKIGVRKANQVPLTSCYYTYAALPLAR